MKNCNCKPQLIPTSDPSDKYGCLYFFATGSHYGNHQEIHRPLLKKSECSEYKRQRLKNWINCISRELKKSKFSFGIYDCIHRKNKLKSFTVDVKIIDDDAEINRIVDAVDELMRG